MKASFTSNFLKVSFGISMLVCSFSLLFLSMGTSTHARAEQMSVADKNIQPLPWDSELRGAVGLGIVKDTAYFVIWGNPNTLYKASIKSARDWYKE